MNELINFLLPYSDESTELFKIYQDCIQNLKAEKNIEVVLRIFELQVLSELGYEINLESEFSNGEPCLLYTSDAADDTPCVDLGGRRIIKKKKQPTTP